MICNNCGSQIEEGAAFCETVRKKSKAPVIVALSVLGVVLIAAAVVILYFFLPSRRLENALGSGRGNAENGYYDRAERAYENALEIDPGNLEAYKGLFDVCMGRENFDDIGDLYDDASDALSKSDFKEFDKYVIKMLESAMKKAVKNEDWELGMDILDVYINLCDDPDMDIINDLDPLSHPVWADPSGPNTPAEVQDEPTREQLGDKYGYGYDVGEMICDFTFYDEDGNSHSISEFEGKAVYINFFTTWCTYCFYELPDMHIIEDDFKGDAVVIMIDLDEGPELGKEYAYDYDVQLPIYYIDGWELEGGLSIDAVPLSIVIDRYGMVYGNHLGMADYDWMYDTMECAVNTTY
ncbi:MAG: redoxin domain-containing protein [Lachnospiraceae bacterium]|nr:redoxin domain-containing protein [Lachnospiraceae bacterium]